MSSTGPPDTWSVGERYEPYIGRWSRLVAPEFVAWLARQEGERWLDIGCGTGALSEAIVHSAAPSRVLGVDPSTAFVDYARAHVTDAAAQFELGSADDLPLPANSCDVVVSGLVLNFVPDQTRALREMVRVTVGGGVVAAYVWDYPGEMWLLRHFWEAAVELDPGAAELYESRRFARCRPETLHDLWEASGLTAVETRGIVVPTVFESFDDYWTPFLGGQGPAPSYLQSLPESGRARLRESLRARLPADADGSVRLTARAWAVRGTA